MPVYLLKGRLIWQPAESSAGARIRAKFAQVRPAGCRYRRKTDCSLDHVGRAVNTICCRWARYLVNSMQEVDPRAGVWVFDRNGSPRQVFSGWLRGTPGDRTTRSTSFRQSQIWKGCFGKLTGAAVISRAFLSAFLCPSITGMLCPGPSSTSHPMVATSPSRCSRFCKQTSACLKTSASERRREL